MAANGSSANTANIITALGNAFKDPSGASMSNDRLAAVLLQNMNQLNDLAKQGKLNQQQIMQVCHDICTKPRSYCQYLYPFTTSYGTMQTSTSPRQSRYVLLFHGHTPIKSSPSRRTNGVTLALSLCPLARAQPAPSVGFLGPQNDDGQLDRPDAERKRDIEGHIPDQRGSESNEPRSGSMVDGSCGTANALGWHNGGSYSRCVSAFRFVTVLSPRAGLN